MNITSIAVAAIGAITAITGAWFTANATSNARVNKIDTQVQLVERTQTLQYTELKTAVEGLRADVKEILKAVK